MKRSYYQRITRRLVSTKKSYQSDCLFSKELARARLADDLGGRLGLKGISARGHAKKDALILNWLTESLQPVLDRYRDDGDPGEYQERAPVWVCWWSGFDTAPALVQQCIRSIERNAGDHPVHLITEETYGAYLEIPAYILEKVQSGAMGFAHLSDYIRVALIAEYGGIWLDATVFCAAELPEEYFCMPVFTCRSGHQADSPYISRMDWTSFVLGGYRGSAFFRCLREMLEAYWQRESVSIDYLLLDYVIYLARKYTKVGGQYLPAVPINNLRRDDLQAAMNAALPAERFYEIVQPDTVLYKLSWRETYDEVSADGGESVYGYFLRMKFEGGSE